MFDTDPDDRGRESARGASGNNEWLRETSQILSIVAQPGELRPQAASRPPGFTSSAERIQYLRATARNSRAAMLQKYAASTIGVAVTSTVTLLPANAQMPRRERRTGKYFFMGAREGTEVSGGVATANQDEWS